MTQILADDLAGRASAARQPALIEGIELSREMTTLVSDRTLATLDQRRRAGLRLRDGAVTHGRLPASPPPNPGALPIDRRCDLKWQHS